VRECFTVSTALFAVSPTVRLTFPAVRAARSNALRTFRARLFRVGFMGWVLLTFVVVWGMFHLRLAVSLGGG
jgi:hypothetical protein